MITFLFLSSGLFLGWSLGANDAANVFGTAVGSRMLKFRTAAVIASVFIILGAARSGSGTVHTISTLGNVNMAAGAFTVALSAALVVYWMTRLSLPVSTSQAIVGAIVGWNIFSGSLTDMHSLSRIAMTWILSPLIAAGVSFLLYGAARIMISKIKIHLLSLDHYIRIGFIIAGAFGAYALGANNIANVMGVFLPVSPFTLLHFGSFSVSSAEQLFFLGGVAIAAGVVSYSYRVMSTVGKGILKLTPLSALVVTIATGIVLFLFASEGLEYWLASRGLPTFPLVPVSSSQAVVGAVIGVALTRGGRGLDASIVARISSGWVITPILAGVVGFFSLFVIQNVFNQQVTSPVYYQVTAPCEKELKKLKLWNQGLETVRGKTFESAQKFDRALIDTGEKTSLQVRDQALALGKLQKVTVTMAKLPPESVNNFLSPRQVRAVKLLEGRRYMHAWQLQAELAARDASWKLKKVSVLNKKHNREIRLRVDFLIKHFSEKK